MLPHPGPQACRRPSAATVILKRGLDVVGSALGLLLLAPLFAVTALAIKLDSPGPVFFRQRRVGLAGRPFVIFKFRSMAACSAEGHNALTVRADRRVTRVGAILRSSKIDELPQLINVLIGDMSLVGPRPEVPEFLQFYTAEQRAVITSMLPGLTDYAAILFRDEASLLAEDRDPVAVYRYEIMPIKYAYYERYSREIGIGNDLRIAIATVLLLICGRVPHWFGIEYELRPLSLQRRTQAGAGM
jgi:lipopolysaccharide/colanic/teichoic acid biosynthesis glycosyltransferase